jgi:hypothetical protein
MSPDVMTTVGTNGPCGNSPTRAALPALAWAGTLAPALSTVTMRSSSRSFWTLGISFTRRMNMWGSYSLGIVSTENLRMVTDMGCTGPSFTLEA